MSLSASATRLCIEDVVVFFTIQKIAEICDQIKAMDMKVLKQLT